MFAKAGRPVRLTFARYHRHSIVSAPDAVVNEHAAITTDELSISSNLSQSHTLSSWQARGAVADWLERQGAHGRSKLLVPELLSLEAVLVKLSQGDPKAWIRALRQLVQELRWGIGAFWAAHYDTSPARARA
eukprot:COSAG02_NODE_35006_length_475_cov_0.898936_1_plen_131_part_10